MRMRRRLGTLALVGILGLASPAAPADSPARVCLQTHLESLQQILCDQQFAGKRHLRQRRQLERVILPQLFDFREMSRRALGAYAPQYEHRMSEFTPLFIEFLEHLSMETLEENGDAKFRYSGETVRGALVEINTKTRLYDGSQYSVDYRLFFAPQGWRVYDVAVEGVSLVENCRAQFERVLRRKSFDELLQELKEKRAQLD